MDLFEMSQKRKIPNAPLAYRMRPQNLDEIVGQEHIIGPGSMLRKSIEKDLIHSFVLFGPPGTGKTTIAQIIAKITNSHFEQIQAVTAGVKDIRNIASDAAEKEKFYQQKTILFVDEIHRFNKAQQDVLLPFVEDATLLLIGATTENPLYELNNALLSRLKLYVLEALNDNHISHIVLNAINDKERGLGNYDINIDEESLLILARTVKGDARMALNILETVVNSYIGQDFNLAIRPELLQKVTGKPLLKFDKTGDYHYDSISAFIKSIRGSDPDAALFWLAVMLEGGEDPKFIARRLLVHAAEDIGLADPPALSLASATAYAVQFIGMPEARIPLAETTIYLAAAPKSNSSKIAIDKAIETVRNLKKIVVPAHIADTSHSRAAALLGKGQGYKYPHDYGGYVKQTYLPDELEENSFYKPGNNGYEQHIKKFLDSLFEKE